MKTYELTYIVGDLETEAAASSVMQEVTKELERLKGVIVKEEPWGKRRLAYPIGKNQYGTYVTILTHLDGGVVKDIERFMRLNENVIRHIVLTAEPVTSRPTDEAELAQALDKRVEEKISAEPAKTAAAKPAEALAESTVAEEESAKPKRTRAKSSSSNEEQKNAENEIERKKLVDEKLSQILGE